MQHISRVLSFVVLCTFFCISSFLNAEAEKPEKQSLASKRRVLGLIEYISGDYPGAVKEGKVLHEGEYAEMQEFARTAGEIAHTLREYMPSESYALIEASFKDLNTCVLEKCAHEKLLQITRFLKEHLLVDFKINSAPAQRPDFELGKKIYHTHCESCHGLQGNGDGPASAALKPPPRSFHEESALEQASPFKYLNTLHTGVSGTGMLSFDNVLNDEEMWSASFYVMGLHYRKDSTESGSDAADKEWELREDHDPKSLPPDIAFLSSRTNAELKTWLKTLYPEDQIERHLAFLRNLAPYAEDIPLQKSEISKSYPWDFIHKKMQDAKEQFELRNFQEASGSLLDAYLEGFEKIEAALAVADHDLLLTLERNFSVARTFASKGDSENFHKSIPELTQLINDAQLKLVKPEGVHGDWILTEFFSSLIIILREGFEAFLIIVALLMIVKNLHAGQSSLWIHAGWISAVILGVITYFVFEKILMLSGAARESIEAFCTLSATVVLFYTGFWLLSHTEHEHWQKAIKVKTKEAISKHRLWLLFGIAFVAVFRESAETVLFYAALLSSAESSFSVWIGFLVGLLSLFIICLAILKFHVHLPLKRFFQTTSFFMVLISIILSGKAVHELIAAGYLKASPLNGVPMIDVLGLYPLWESVLAQGFVIALSLILWSRSVMKS